MKTFDKLTTKDKLYRIDFSVNVLGGSDMYNNYYSSDFISSYDIKSIHAIENGIGINRYERGGFMLELIGSAQFGVTVREQKKEYILWCADENALNGTVRKELLRIINEKELSIPNYKKRIENEIYEIRKKYYDFLNKQP